MNKTKQNLGELSPSEKIEKQSRISTDNISDLFVEFSSSLAEKLSINRSVLILNQQQTNQLAAISTWENGDVRDGLTITLPSESSLLIEVAEKGVANTIDSPVDFSGNFFEKKLLFNSESKSLMIQPLIHDEKVIGLVTLSSISGELTNQKSQSLIQEAAEQLASLIIKRNNKDATV